MPFTPGPYSGVSTLALVARASALGVGVVYGAVKLSILKSILERQFWSRVRQQNLTKRRRQMRITEDRNAWR
uniref:Uncharacterized protein n=1 Tax=Oryza glumipatula TaxID=40148 RepID=A0A0D9ZGH1_9ORYZ